MTDMPVESLTSVDDARSRDDADDAELASIRDGFAVPVHDGNRATYLCGNSLGLLHRSVREELDRVLDDWAGLAVDAHYEGTPPWLPYHELVRDDLADIVGGLPHEVVAMNSLTANLHFLMAAFYRPTPDRAGILIETDAFPSDRYAVASQIRWHGHDPARHLHTVGTPGRAFDLAELESVLAQRGDQIALVLLGGVNYFTGQSLDLAAVTRLGHRYGCVVGFDLAHSAGNVPLSLHDDDVDFAAWCTYKYLNAGPGAVAGAFIHERHDAPTRDHRLAGWWGHQPETRFAMDENWEFAPRPGADGWQLSNPPILALAPVRASAALFTRVGMATLRARSLRLTGLLEAGIDRWDDRRIQILTPRDPDRRGAQLSLRFGGDVDGFFSGLAARGIVGDVRRPDVIRLAPAPIYNTHVDVWRALEALGATLAEIPI
jgi:kynureninase